MRQEITVNEAAGQINTEASSNLDVITLDRDLLDNLPIFDQNYVGAMSQFLDPGSISTGGVTLVVNGMEQKNIGVSASAIQQVKINQNPYSAEFSRPGRGRIEIITKPESQVYHGSLNVIFRDYRMNARDPFASSRPEEQRRIFEGSLVGPLGKSGNNSFLISANREEQDLQAIVFASAPSGLVQQNVANPQRNTEFSAGVTHQFSGAHLGSFRGSYRLLTEKNRGVGGFVLPESGVNYEDREDELMYNDSLVVTPKLINQFRIMFGRQHTPTTSVLADPSIVVLGAFTAGGAQADRLQTENHINMNEIVSWSPGKHQIKAGINVPDISRRGLNDHTNSGGTYTFSSMQDYRRTARFHWCNSRAMGRCCFLKPLWEGSSRTIIEFVLTSLLPQEFVTIGRISFTTTTSSRLDLFCLFAGKDRKTVLRGGARNLLRSNGASADLRY